MDRFRAAWVTPTIVGLLGLTCCTSATDKLEPDAAKVAPGIDQTGGDAGEETTPAQVHCPADLEPFAIGSTSGKGKVLGATVVAADPKAPERWLNDWEVQLTNADGEPAPDAQVDFARPWMPIHGHDGNVLPMIASMGDGRFSLMGINFNMRGPWEVQLKVSSPTLGKDDIVINVCVVE